MWGKKKWWETKTKENQTDDRHYKPWCVIKRVKNFQHDINKWEGVYSYEYVAVGRSNAPEYYDPQTMKLVKSVYVDNLTKAEAIAMAKMLNFVADPSDGVIRETIY
jgi:hypothetical protein